MEKVEEGIGYLLLWFRNKLSSKFGWNRIEKLRVNYRE